MALTKIKYSPGDVLTSTQVNAIQDEIIKNNVNIEYHIADKTNPHNITAEKIGAAKINIGTYVGTGTYGTTKNSITFEFEPKLLVVTANDISDFKLIIVRGQTIASVYANESMSHFVNITWSGKTVSWVSNMTPETQLNASHITYHYCAIG